MDRLTKEIRGKQAAQDALQQTTVKGITYEETVVAELQHWSKLTGAEVHHVGTDNNSGDILIKLTPKSIAATELSIIIEARDRSSQLWGRKQISEHLNKAMAQRGANANDIEAEAETLKTELRDALTSIKDAVRDGSSEI